MVGAGFAGGKAISADGSPLGERIRGEANAAIERELKQAAEIQVRLVPKPLKVGSTDIAVGFQPSRWVAGDYVDIVPLPDGRVLLLIADVCGKGMQAALVTMQLHTSVRTAAARNIEDVANLVELLISICVRICRTGRL